MEKAGEAIQAGRDLAAVWERWWAEIGGTPGEIVWDADAGDLAADLGHFAAPFGQRIEPAAPRAIPA